MPLISFQDERLAWLGHEPAGVKITDEGHSLALKAEPGKDWWRTPDLDRKDGQSALRAVFVRP
jgi:hypothetical protein